MQETLAQETLAMIKPDAVKRNLVGHIVAMMEDAGLTVRAMKMVHLDRRTAGGFYAVHEGKPFYEGLVEYMTSGPVVCLVLAGDDAIARYRALMGPTDPAKAPEGTIRQRYAESMRANSVHGSDSPESAAFEISYFFNAFERVRS